MSSIAPILVLCELRRCAPVASTLIVRCLCRCAPGSPSSFTPLRLFHMSRGVPNAVMQFSDDDVDDNAMPPQVTPAQDSVPAAVTCMSDDKQEQTQTGNKQTQNNRDPLNTALERMSLHAACNNRNPPNILKL